MSYFLKKGQLIWLFHVEKAPIDLTWFDELCLAHLTFLAILYTYKGGRKDARSDAKNTRLRHRKYDSTLFTLILFAIFLFMFVM